MEVFLNLQELPKQEFVLMVDLPALLLLLKAVDGVVAWLFVEASQG